MSAGQVRSARSALEAERAETLASALRVRSVTASEIAGGGLSLIFVRSSDVSGVPPRLRAAAGFASPEAARSGAMAVEGMVRDAIETGQVQIGKAEVSLGDRGDGGLWVTPITFEGRIHGALAVASAAELSEDAIERLRALAQFIGLHLDHYRLVAEVERLEFQARR